MASANNMESPIPNWRRDTPYPDNGSAESGPVGAGWGDGLPGLAQRNHAKKDIGIDEVRPDVYTVVWNLVDPAPMPRTKHAPLEFEHPWDEVDHILKMREIAAMNYVDREDAAIKHLREQIAKAEAAAAAKEDDAKAGKPVKKVACSIVETFGDDVAPRDLEETLRMEYRTKLLNPRWAEAMSQQGSGGAYEISQRMTALVGWGATSGFAEDWVYDGAHERYVEDEEMRERLRKANPQAFRNVLKRMLEAAGRGLWNADEDVLNELKSLYAETEDALEGVTTRR